MFVDKSTIRTLSVNRVSKQRTHENISIIYFLISQPHFLHLYGNYCGLVGIDGSNRDDNNLSTNCTIK